MKKHIHSFGIGLIILAISLSCNNVSDSGSDTSGAWLIPKNQIRDGGPGKDGIPALSNPNFVDASQANYLSNNDLVIGLKMGNDIKAFPHKILDWHEIINASIGNKALAVTYCPLTGSAITWNRVINGSTTTFGVSGLLYNSNLIPYDRMTDSNWSQMWQQCVNGDLIGRAAEFYPIVETAWGTWKSIYPQTTVVSNNTGVYSSSRYNNYPYQNPTNGDYRTNQSWLLFPVENLDDRLPRKQRVLGVNIGDKSKAYQISEFTSAIKTINDTINGVPVVVSGSSSKNFAVAFQRAVSDSVVLTFSALQNELPAVMVDNEGTKWDIFGNGISGPRSGQKLGFLNSYIAFWFAWAAFYPNTEIYTF